MIPFLLFGISALNFLLALLFCSKVFKNPAHLFFTVFILAAGFWPLSIAFFLLSESLASAYFWDKIIYLSGTVVPVSFIFFAMLFTRRKMPALPVMFLYFILPAGLMFLVLFSDLFIKNINFVPGAVTVHLGEAYIIWVIYFCSYMAIGAWYLFDKYLKSSGLDKLQLSYILLALLFPIAGALPFNIVLPFFGNYQLIHIGPFFLTVMATVISYAVIRHRLMDIRLVAARTIAYSLLLIIISSFYVGAAFLLSSMLLGLTAGLNQTLIYTGLTVFVALSFERLRLYLEKITDKIFFRGRYDTDELLSRLGYLMSTNIELEPLAAQTLQVLIEQMRITRAAFIILGESPASVYDFVNIGFSKDLKLYFNEISNFIPNSETIIFDDLEETRIKEVMREFEVSIIKILRVKNEAVGVLFLGEKASGEIFSNEDLKILEIIVPEMAVAIQNSLSYDKIKKFNVTLTQEVNKATADLQSANQKLEVLDRLKDDFVSIASHELRTPMTAIRSYAWMALHRSDVPLSKTLEKYIARILISTERMVNLVNDMLNISRIESGSIEINPEPVDLLSLIKDIVDEVYFSKSEEKNIQFVVAEKRAPKAFADPQKLRQVFLNIVGNSLKFTPGGGKITFDFFTDGQTVEISVRDTGIGILKEDISKLFRKFSRLDNSYTAAATSGGTGLGLYISKKLIELMHGSIRVKSEGSGKGTTFTVSLPVATEGNLKNAEQFTVKAQGIAKPLEPVAL